MLPALCAYPGRTRSRVYSAARARRGKFWTASHAWLRPLVKVTVCAHADSYFLSLDSGGTEDMSDLVVNVLAIN